jgi:hypothetical protein
MHGAFRGDGMMGSTFLCESGVIYAVGSTQEVVCAIDLSLEVEVG